HRYHQSALADEAIEFGAAGGLKLLAQKGPGLASPFLREHLALTRFPIGERSRVRLATVCGRVRSISITTTRASATTGPVMSIERAREEEIGAEAEAGVSFSIAATGPETRIRRTLKHNDPFLVIDAHGDIGAAAGTSDGLFPRDTRFLSRLE